MKTVVHRHLPAGFPRTARINDHPALSDFALRILPSMLAGDVEPTGEAVRARYHTGRFKAYAALRNLEQWGFLHRWRRSIGRDTFLHFAVVTDEPFAWDADPALAARMIHLEDQAVARARDELVLDPARPVPPPAELSTGAVTSDNDVISQVNSCAGGSQTINSQTTMKDSSGGIFTPMPPRGGQPVHRGRRVRDYAERILLRLRSIPAELEPYTANALALLAGLQMAPADRARHACTVAAALASGRSLGQMTAYLTDDLASARDRKAVINWRLRTLARTLESEGATATS